MKHLERHPTPQPDCFGCKLQSINWGIVPGAYRDTNSTSTFDKDAVMKQFTDKDGVPVFSKERVEDNRSDLRRAQKEFLSYG